MHNPPLRRHSDVLIVGAGPAGASAAILLAQAGWKVTLVEQHVYPRQKVCGECIAAGNFELLDELGIGQAVRRLSGPVLKHAGWMRGDTSVVARMPECVDGAEEYGRALGRDVLDNLLLERARAVGVRILQPARVRQVWGTAGNMRCKIEHFDSTQLSSSPRRATTIASSILIDAHGSWESGPQFEAAGVTEPRIRRRASDLFAFKATYARSGLTHGLLPIVAFNGGYGGMVVANDGRTTVAFCVRRDALRAIRAKQRGVSAATSVESYLRESCCGVQRALKDATRAGAWLAVGPLRPGLRLSEISGVFRVGNAAGETHPLIGEGISMALQSSKLLATCLLSHAQHARDTQGLRASHDAYVRAWRTAFIPRLRLAAVYAQMAMHAPLAAPLGEALKQWPTLLTTAARFAGKARRALCSHTLSEETI